MCRCSCAHLSTPHFHDRIFGVRVGQLFDFLFSPKRDGAKVNALRPSGQVRSFVYRRTDWTSDHWSVSLSDCLSVFDRTTRKGQCHLKRLTSVRTWNVAFLWEGSLFFSFAYLFEAKRVF